MNKTIKIILISLVVIGIASVIIYFINGTTTPSDTSIATTPFEKEIESQVASEIKGQDYSTASSAFFKILADIKTEASIVNADGNKQLSDNEVSNCKKIAFCAYEPIFENYQSAYFNRSSWDDAELKALKSRAQDLLAMNIAEGTAKHNIAKVVDIVNDYHAAWSVVKSARNCNSVAAVNSIKSKAASYNHAPLTNNASLRAGLNSAYSDAKSSLANNINAHCNRVAQGYKNYGSYVRFFDAEDAALNRINEYINAFGGNFSNAKSVLIQADKNATEYYRNNEDD